MTNALSIDDLQAIREKLCSFILDQVISPKGEFHCKNPGPNLIEIFLLSFLFLRNNVKLQL
jgi:hypothetical protein